MEAELKKTKGCESQSIWLRGMGEMITAQLIDFPLQALMETRPKPKHGERIASTKKNGMSSKPFSLPVLCQTVAHVLMLIQQHDEKTQVQLLI